MAGDALTGSCEVSVWEVVGRCWVSKSSSPSTPGPNQRYLKAGRVSLTGSNSGKRASQRKDTPPPAKVKPATHILGWLLTASRRILSCRQMERSVFMTPARMAQRQRAAVAAARKTLRQRSARARQMQSMRDKGCSDVEIAAHFKLSKQRVHQILGKQPDRKDRVA